MSGKYTIHVPQPIPIAGGGSIPVAKEHDRLTPSTPAEKQAAATRVQWHAKGHGRAAYLEMFCPLCSLQTTIENPSLNAKVFHCGRMERCPDRKYEELCHLRDNDGRPRIPERQVKVRWI